MSSKALDAVWVVPQGDPCGHCTELKSLTPKVVWITSYLFVELVGNGFILMPLLTSAVEANP